MRIVKLGAIQPETRHGNPVETGMAYIENQLDTTLGLLEKAGAEGCDIIVTCEDAAMLSHLTTDDDSVFSEYVIKSVPYIEAAFSQTAKKFNMHVVGCYMKKHGEKIYNTASVFDRGGKIAGAYRKAQLPANETWQVEPGDDLNVIGLDFGKIGISICYDMMFPETVRVLVLKGAEVIFHPTFGYGWYDSIGEATLRVRANDNGVYIVTSKNYIYNGAGKSSIIDPWGHVLADAGFEKNVIVTREIDLDIEKTQPNYYINGHISGEWNVKTRMFKERRPELYGRISEANEKLRVADNIERDEIRKGLQSGRIHW